MADRKAEILIADDALDLRRALRASLSALGFEITEASNGEQAIQAAAGHPFDVVLLDINMPGMGGVEACRKIRESHPSQQVLMLTVRDSEADKIKALDAGADDYVTKPFSIPELAARIRAAVRRATAGQREAPKTIVVGELELDVAHRVVRKGERVLRFTPKEFDLLHYLMSHAGVPLTHVKLLRSVWGPEYGQEMEYLRTFVHHLRKKIEDDPASPQYLVTEPYLGYRFQDPGASMSSSNF
jgi:two-component system, OmpR family, KDP operon response regulator KdpE